MEDAGRQDNAYKRLAEEIGAVLASAAETAEKMLEDARLEADGIREEAESDRRTAYADGRRVLDEARMEADMVRAEAEWQAQEIIAMARRQAAERIAGADARLAELHLAENRVMDRLAGVGQVVSETLAGLRDRAADQPIDAAHEPYDPAGEHDGDQPSAKVYFVEFPPPAPIAPAADGGGAEIVIPEPAQAAAVNSDTEQSEWARPGDLPTWWTQGATEG